MPKETLLLLLRAEKEAELREAIWNPEVTFEELQALWDALDDEFLNRYADSPA